MPVAAAALFIFALSAPAALAQTATPVAAAAAKNSITSKQIKNKQVKSKDLAKGAVKAKSLAANAVDGTKVRDRSLSGADIFANSLTGAEIRETSLDFKVLQARLQGSCAPGEAIRSVDALGRLTCESIVGELTGVLGGDLTGMLPNPSIALGAVTTPKLADDAITSAKVAANELTGDDLLESSLGIVPNADQLDGINSADFALDTDLAGFLRGADSASGDLAGSTFNDLQLAANVVGSGELADSATTDADRAVTTDHIRNDAITGAKVAANELTGDDLLESSLGIVPNADQLDGIDYSAIDARFDALCAQAETQAQEFNDLRAALDAAGLIGLDLSTVSTVPAGTAIGCRG